jgi:hypothetical protein
VVQYFGKTKREHVPCLNFNMRVDSTPLRVHALTSAVSRLTKRDNNKNWNQNARESCDN